MRIRCLRDLPRFAQNPGMCERFYITAKAVDIKKAFKVDSAPEFGPRYNIAPTQSSPIVVAVGKLREVHLARWGLVPSWSRDLSRVSRMANAPAETIEDKPAFRTPFHTQRCLVPANGYYEWRGAGAKKQPYKIALRTGALLAFGGIWEKWTPETGEPVETFSIITTQANKLVNEISERMPVIIAPTDYSRWLAGPVAMAKKLLTPFTGGMTINPVSERVNSLKNDDVELLVSL
jgi:putative SOS response-associated peptidase YedK